MIRGWSMQRMLEFCLVSTGTNMALAREVVASHIGCPLRKTGAFSMYLIAGSAAFSTASTFRCFAQREGEREREGGTRREGGGKGRREGEGERPRHGRRRHRNRAISTAGRRTDRRPPAPSHLSPTLPAHSWQNSPPVARTDPSRRFPPPRPLPLSPRAGPGLRPPPHPRLPQRPRPATEGDPL